MPLPMKMAHNALNKYKKLKLCEQIAHMYIFLINVPGIVYKLYWRNNNLPYGHIY